MKLKGRAIPKHKAGVMNGLERSYSVRLETMKQAGLIKWYTFESITLKLAKDTRYTPDFAVINNSDELEYHEIKGFWRDDAKVKIKVAAEMFPFIFKAFTVEKGCWVEKDFTVW